MTVCGVAVAGRVLFASCISSVSYTHLKTKREEFLEIMEEIIPWDEWVGVIEPYYPKGKRGRPPMGIDLMLSVPRSVVRIVPVALSNPLSCACIV